VYYPETGELAIEAPKSKRLTSYNIESAAGIFRDPDCQWECNHKNIFWATFAAVFGSRSLGNVAQRDLSEEYIRNDLTVVGSLSGGGDLGEVDLIYIGSGFEGLDFAGKHLESADFSDDWLGYADFSGADLTGADFHGAILSRAGFAGALIARADFAFTTGFTAEQLYSTASYQQGNLTGIGLGGNNLRGWNFAGKNLSRATLGGWEANLSGADFTGGEPGQCGLLGGVSRSRKCRPVRSDLRGAEGFSPATTTLVRNTIWPDGTVTGFDIRLAIRSSWRDHERLIEVRDRFVIGRGWRAGGSSRRPQLGLETDAQLGGSHPTGWHAPN